MTLSKIPLSVEKKNIHRSYLPPVNLISFEGDVRVTLSGVELTELVPGAIVGAKALVGVHHEGYMSPVAVLDPRGGCHS